MSRVEDKTPAAACACACDCDCDRYCSCPCYCVLLLMIQRRFELADGELRNKGILSPHFMMCINEIVVPLFPDFTNRKTKQDSAKVMRDCCVSFSPQDVTLICETWVRPTDSPAIDFPAAEDPNSHEVVTVDFETPCYNTPFISHILRGENGDYAGLDTPIWYDRVNEEAAGVSGFYPSKPPSLQERDAARDRLRRILDPDYFARLCALADNPAKAA